MVWAVRGGSGREVLAVQTITSLPAWGSSRDLKLMPRLLTNKLPSPL